MNFRTTLFMLGLLLGVGVLVYFGRKGPGTEDITKKNNNVFAEPFSDKVTHIELKRGEETLVFEKADKEWSITSPFKEAANGANIDMIKSDFDFLKKEQTFAPGDPKIDMKAWELDPPKAVITLKGTDVSHTIKIGALTANKKQGYVIVDDAKEIYVVGCELYNAVVEKKASEFRNKTLLKFDSFAVDRFTLTWQGQDVECAYQDSNWRVVRPAADRADAEVVNEILRVAHDLAIKDFVEDAAKDLKKYALDMPQLKLSIVPRGEATAQTLLFGGEKDGDKTKVCVRRENSDNVVAVEANDVEKLKRTVDDLRDKKLLDFDEHEISSISITRVAKDAPKLGGRFLDTLYRAMGHVRREPIVTLENLGNEWLITEPAAYPFDASRVSSWLEELKDTRVVEFRDSETPAGDPYRGGADAAIELVLERKPFGSSVTQRMAFPLIPIDANKTATWRPNGEHVVAIGSNLLGRLQRGAANFRRRLLLSVQPAQVTKVVIETPDAKVEAEKKEDWKLISPGALDEDALGDVLRRFGTLVVKDVLADDPDQVKATAIGRTTLTVTVTYGSEMAPNAQGPRLDQTASLQIGEKGDNGYVAIFSQEGGQRVPAVVVLDDATVNDLSKKVLK